MKHWTTFGAFGSDVIELTWSEWIGMAFGRELQFMSTVVSLGKSSKKALRASETREEQLERQAFAARRRRAA